MKNLLLKIPFFAKRKELREKAEQEQIKWAQELMEAEKKFIANEIKFRLQDMEFERVESIKEALKERQKILKASPARQVI